MKNIIAKKYLCFDAILEMIVTDNTNHSIFSQDHFAEMFGITIPNDENISIRNVHYSSNTREYGTTISVSVVNDFFRKNSIKLKLSFVQSNILEEMTFNDFIKQNSKHAYIVFAYCYGILYNEPQNIDVGHVSLFESIDEKTDTFKIYDPGPRNSGSKIVKSDDMFAALKRRGGIYIFTKTNESL